MDNVAFLIFDLLGTFAFAISGALAAKERDLDLFGVLAVAYITACGGGIIRDLCIGSIPPAGISDWRYLACSIVAALITILSQSLVDRFKEPVFFFDAIGLGFFAVFGTYKTLLYGHNYQAAIILGMVTAVGGGVLRDILLNHVPVILRKEIYALAALIGSAIFVLGNNAGLDPNVTPWLASLLCVGMRLLALRYSWQLPVFSNKRD